MSEKNQFDWIPFYEEFADKLLAYKDNRQELIEFLTNYIMNAPDKVLSLLYHFAINFTIKK